MKSQETFFDAKVLDANANRYLNKALSRCYIQNENEKKWKYNERVLETDWGSFTPLYSQFIGVLEVCNRFHNRLAKKIAEKRELPQSTNCHKLDMNKNIFFVIEVDATMFTRIQKYWLECIFRRWQYRGCTWSCKNLEHCLRYYRL